MRITSGSAPSFQRSSGFPRRGRCTAQRPLSPLGSTSLALINCWLCFFALCFPAMAGRDCVKVRNYGSGPWHRFSPSRAATYSSLPCPLDLFHSPVGGAGGRLAAVGEEARPRPVSYCQSQDAVDLPGFVMRSERHGNYNFSQ